ncbi:MAG: hypothetical protein ABIN25_01135 [Ginsengibacter sp.]
MASKFINNGVALFPHYFKKIGIVVMVLAFIPAIVAKVMNIEFLLAHKEILKMVTISSFILGLAFFALSKDKIEDEVTIHIRLKAAAWVFSFAVFYVILTPVTSLIFENKIEALSAAESGCYYVIGIRYYAFSTEKEQVNEKYKAGRYVPSPVFTCNYSCIIRNNR